MADITMCLGKNCDVKYKCYIFKAEPSIHQSYGAFLHCKNNKYSDFWDIESNEPKIPKCKINGKFI